MRPFSRARPQIVRNAPRFRLRAVLADVESLFRDSPTADRCGQAPYFRQARQQTLLTAYAAHPERIVRGLPTPPPLPHAVWINMPKKTRPGVAKTSYITGDICLILLDTFRWPSGACAKAQQDGVD